MLITLQCKMGAVIYIRFFLSVLYLLNFVHGSSHHDKHFNQRCVEGSVHPVEVTLNSTQWPHLTNVLEQQLSTISNKNFDGIFTRPSNHLQDKSISFKMSDKTRKIFTKDNMSDIKQHSSVSELYSLCTKVSLDVNFQFDVSGPAHMKNYKSTCTVGGDVTHGIGSSKSGAKTQAAAAMLKKIKNNLADLSKARKVDKTRRSIKFSPDTDPIPYLQEWSIHRVKYEEGQHTKDYFIYNCFWDGMETTGFGRSKKIAKKAAATEMIGLLNNERKLNEHLETNLQAEKQSGNTIGTDANIISKLDMEMNLTPTSKPNSFENERQSENLEDLLKSIGKDMGYNINFRSEVYYNVHVSFVSISSGSTVSCYGVGVDEKQSRQETSRAAIEYLLSLIGIENIDVGKKEDSVYKNYFTSQMSNFYLH